MAVPLLDLQAQGRNIQVEIAAALRHVIDTHSFVLGPAVESFETEFADYCNVKHCVAVNSGTSALHLALVCLNVGPNHEVITVPMTFAATVWSISYVGAKPVFVDIDAVRRTMDPALLRRAITNRTGAIMPVHLYGIPADMEAICAIANQHGIPVVEDAAQAHGARFRGRRVGSFGRVACFSFYPSKNLGGYGEGGALVTDDDEIAARARRLRDQGQTLRYMHDEVGYNYRMDGLQGAVLAVKLKYLDAWNSSRANCARRYQELLAGLPCGLPTEPPDSQSAWHLYVIEAAARDQTRKRMEEFGVQTGTHYPVPMHLQDAYANLGFSRGSFPISERLAERCLSLPLYPELTEKQLAEVSQSLRKACTESSLHR
jgi:dTDP-4-amino-4,6-dideoxygalactose transaminase